MTDQTIPKIVCLADASPGAGVIELASFLLRHFPDWGCAKIELDTEAGPSVWVERQGGKLLASGTDTAFLAANSTSEIIKIGVHPESVNDAIDTIRKEFSGSPGVIAVGAIADNADVTMVAATPDVRPDESVRARWNLVCTAAFLHGRIPEKAIEDFFRNYNLAPVPFLPLTGDLVNIIREKIGQL